jgi:uncharacterized Fe-S center protein
MSKVYFSPATGREGIEEALGRLYEKVSGGFDVRGERIAVKTHFGEKGNETFLDPAFAKKICEIVRSKGGTPELVECNTLYRGERMKTEDHLKLAKAHGFDFAPIVICDDGGKEWVIPVKGRHFSGVKIGALMKNYRMMIAVSHCKGHIAAGYGGALKNVGMGLGSRAGKLEMHAKVKPVFKKARCRACGICVRNCPADAITLEEHAFMKVFKKRYAVMDEEKCIGCATCIAVCPHGAVEIPWGGATHEELQERIAEYALGVTQNVRTVYFNLLVNITPKCDCIAKAGKPLMDDIGVLASADPVAIEQASIDKINERAGKDVFKEKNNIDVSVLAPYAESLGMGERKYEIVKV